MAHKYNIFNHDNVIFALLKQYIDLKYLKYISNVIEQLIKLDVGMLPEISQLSYVTRQKIQSDIGQYMQKYLSKIVIAHL